jgi:hypothetical protein
MYASNTRRVMGMMPEEIQESDHSLSLAIRSAV